MPYSGAWRTARTSRADGTRYTDPPPKLGAPELSALHMEPTPEEPGARPPWAVVHQEDVPAWLTDPGDAYDPIHPAEARGLVLDHEPEGHEGYSGAGAGQSLREAQAAGNAARSIDRGADARQLYRAPRMRASDEVRTTSAEVLEPISSGSALGTVRGRNSLPENNPEGFRTGVRIRRWTERKIPRENLRHHNPHPLRLNTAAAANVSPAPTGDAYNRNTSPFSSNIYSRTRVMQSPVARRSPRAWDEDVVTDGTETAAVPESYVVWGL